MFQSPSTLPTMSRCCVLLRGLSIPRCRTSGLLTFTQSSKLNNLTLNNPTLSYMITKTVHVVQQNAFQQYKCNMFFRWNVDTCLSYSLSQKWFTSLSELFSSFEEILCFIHVTRLALLEYLNFSLHDFVLLNFR